MATMSLYPQDPRVRREAEALARKAVAVDVVCLRGPDQPAREQFGSVTAHRVRRIGKKSSVPKYIWQSVLFYRAAAAALATLYQQQRFDLIQIHNLPDYLVYVARPFKKEGVPVLLDLHDLMPELFTSRWRSPLLRPLAALIEHVHRSSCNFADHLLTASGGFERRLLTRGVPPQRITLVLNSADHHIFSADRQPVRRREGPLRLLYHGSLAQTLAGRDHAATAR
jgi:glycosyltransferase involved in cell wall biosynthesis